MADWEDAPTSGGGWEDADSGPTGIKDIAEAAATFIPKQLAGGLGGLAQAAGAKLGGATWEEAGQELQKGYEEAQKPAFISKKAPELQAKFMELLGKGVDAATSWAETFGAEPEKVEQGDPAGKFISEMMLNVAPIPGLEGLHGAFKPRLTESGRMKMSPMNLDQAKQAIAPQLAVRTPDTEPTQPVDPRQLLATEEQIKPGGGETPFPGWNKDPEGNETPLILQTPDGQQHIVDGHHHVDKAIAEGKSEINARIIQEDGSDLQQRQQQTQQEAQTQQQAQIDTANQQSAYLKDLQAPQLGGGGRVARPPDTVGKVKTGLSQMAWDEAMRTLGESYEADRMLRGQQTRSPDVRGTQFRLDQVTQQEPKTRLIGPMGDLRGEPDLIAQEIQQRMQERQPPSELNKPRLTGPRADILPEEPEARLGPSQFNNNLRAIQEKMSRGEEPSWNFRTQLDSIRQVSQVPYYRELAGYLLKDKTFNPRWSGVERFEKNTTAGRYRPSTYEIQHQISHFGDEGLTLHEAIHARTHSAIEGVANAAISHYSSLKFSHLKAPVQRLQNLYQRFYDDYYRKQGIQPGQKRSSVGHPYGLKNVHEFVAEAFSNPEFQAELARTPLPPELRSSGMTMYWNKFVESVGKILGFSKVKMNYLSEVIKAGHDVMEGTDSQLRRTYDHAPSMVDVGGQASKNVVDGMIAAKKQFELETRSAKDVVGDAIKDGLTDISGKFQLGANWLQDRSVAILSQAKGVGRLIKWAVDRTSSIDRMYSRKAEDLLWGTKYQKGFLGREKRVPSTEGMLTDFQRMYNEGGAVRAAWVKDFKNWISNSGVRELTRADFAHPRSWEIYKRMQEGFEKVRQEANQRLEAIGRPTIPKIPSYFPSRWEGDFRVFATDATGKKVWAQGFSHNLKLPFTDKYLPGAAETFAREYRKAHPDLKVEVSSVEPSKYDLADLTSFTEALRVMSGDDPATKALQKTYSDILFKRGFLKTAIHREGVGGHLAMQPGEAGVRNGAKVAEQYINQAYKLMGNLEKQGLIRELNDLPKEVQDKIPNGLKYIRDYIDRARGVKAINLEDDITREMFKEYGLGPSAPKGLINGMSNMVTTLWLWTPRFIASQLTQPLNALPKLADLKNLGKTNGEPLYNYLMGYNNMIRPDALATRGANWAGRQGYLDPTIVHLLNSQLGQDRPLQLREYIRKWQTAPAALAEHHMVRTPTFLMFEHALRDSVKNDEARFREAGELTNHYMVDYARRAAPGIYHKAGLAGDLLRPLKAYSHNFLGQFLEYANIAKDRKELSPTMWFFGTQILNGGLKGMLFVTEVNAAIAAYNWMFDQDMPDLTKLMLTSKLPDMMVFGGLTTATGYDMSTSSAAPSMGSMFSFPIISWSTSAVKDVGTYVFNKLNGKDTAQDRLKAAIALAPRWADEFLKNVFTEPGELTANPAQKDLTGNYRRSENERLVSSISGMKPLNEARWDMVARSARQYIALDLEHRLDAGDAIVSDMLQGKQISAANIQEYLEKGGTPQGLMRSMKDRLLRHEIPFMDQQTIGHPTWDKLHNLQIMQQYLDTNSDSIKQDQTVGLDSNRDVHPMAYSAEDNLPPHSDIDPRWKGDAGMIKAPPKTKDRMPVLPRKQAPKYIST